MRWKVKNKDVWHKWFAFAWRPVKVFGEYVWLETIERERFTTGSEYFWDYRFPE